MANEVMAGLFGVTPEGLAAQREQALQKQALTFAQLDPAAQAQYQLFLGGNRLGGAIGGMLGAQDPELARVAQRQQLLQGVNPSDAASLREAASRALAAGDNQAAAMLGQRAMDVEMAGAKLASEKALTEQRTRIKPDASTATERSRAVIAGLEVKLAKGLDLTPEEEANARWLVSQETKPKMFRDAESGELITINPLDITQAAPNLAKRLGSGAATTPVTPGAVPTADNPVVSPAKGVTVTKVGEGKGPDASTVAKMADIDASLTKLGKSVKELDNIGSRIDNLDLGLVQNFLRGGAAWAGVNTKDRTEFDSLQRKALQEANNLLLLAKGAQTEGDAQRAQQQIADPNTWKNSEALKQAFKDLRDTHANTLAALEAQRATLKSKGKETPAAKPSSGGYSQDQEALINRWMTANKQPREAVVKYLKSIGKL